MNKTFIIDCHNVQFLAIVCCKTFEEAKRLAIDNLMCDDDEKDYIKRLNFAIEKEFLSDLPEGYVMSLQNPL